MKPVKKAKRRQARREEIATLIDPKASRKAVREMDNALIDTEEAMETRYAYAREIFLMQDESTRKAIDMMVEKMRLMAGQPVVKFKGAQIHAEEARLLKIQDHMLAWCAVRLFVACAVWDIQIANFKLPEDKCAKCAKPIGD